MKRLLLFTLGLILTAIIIYSCNKEEIKASYLLNFKNDNSEEIDFTNLNSDLLDQELKNVEESYSIIISKIKDGTLETENQKANLAFINNYLKIQGRSEIDVNKFVNDGLSIVYNESSKFEDVINHVRKYQMYDERCLELAIDLENKLDRSNSNGDKITYINDFMSNIKELDISFIEKNFFFVYGSILKPVVNSEVETRTPCTDCVNSNGRKIFGWAFFVVGALVLACLVLSAGTLIVACLAGAGLFGGIAEICVFCGNECYLLCGS